MKETGSPNDMVYIARRESDGVLKIGVSNNVLLRMTGLKTVNKSDFTLLFVAHGSRDLEKELQLRFRKFALKDRPDHSPCEWFYPSDQILIYAERHMLPAVAVESQITAKPEGTFLTNIRSLIRKKSAEEDRRITLQSVTDAIGISYQTAHRWASGKNRALDHDTLMAFAEYFDCSTNDIIAWKAMELRDKK